MFNWKANDFLWYHFLFSNFQMPKFTWFLQWIVESTIIYIHFVYVEWWLCVCQFVKCGRLSNGYSTMCVKPYDSTKRYHFVNVLPNICICNNIIIEQWQAVHLIDEFSLCKRSFRRLFGTFVWPSLGCVWTEVLIWRSGEITYLADEWWNGIHLLL